MKYPLSQETYTMFGGAVSGDQFKVIEYEVYKVHFK